MFLQLISVAALLYNGTFYSDYYGYVYTPKVSPIYSGFYSGNVNDLLGMYDSHQDGFENVTMLARSNPIYNCFSYAFYKTSSDNNCFIKRDVTLYWTDGSYYTSQGYIGDRIVYFDTEGNPMHAGVIVARTGYPILEGTDDLSKIIVDSKWDWGPLYRHVGNNCPYSHLYNNGYGFHKYYRLNDSHTHSFNYSVIEANSNVLLTTCSCGLTIEQPHHLYNNKDGFECVLCNSKLNVNQASKANKSLKTNNESQYIDNKIFLCEDDYNFFTNEVNYHENI